MDFLPILILLVVVAIVVTRLPKVDLGHSPAFLRRRVMNWLPVGLTYAFLYMGRYNLNATIGTMITKTEFSQIYFWGTLTYGISFLLNGPLTDRFGGKKTILVGSVGVIVANLMLAYVATASRVDLKCGEGCAALPYKPSIRTLALLYSINMYFQSFGAVSIVKVNSAWFHLKERGTFGGIFGILISLGLYFALDWSTAILKSFGVGAVFIVPAAILFVFVILDVVLVQDTPGQAGQKDFDLGDATEAPAATGQVETGAGYRGSALATPPKEGNLKRIGMVAYRMLQNPAMRIIVLIEFCSGYLRNSIMQYYKPFAKDLGRTTDYVLNHWGMLNCIAGICGGIFAGVISDKIFGSRRGPVSAVLYGIMIIGSLLMFVTLNTPYIGWVAVMMTLAIIGVHGMLSGTASADFGGKHNTGIAVGIIDGFVYLGVALEALVLGRVLPEKEAAKHVENWWTWPAAILPFAVIGFLLALKVWNAKAPSKAAAH
jgi:MFS transporter, OPA family, glycerol-3-phosphate transporter